MRAAVGGGFLVRGVGGRGLRGVSERGFVGRHSGRQPRGSNPPDQQGLSQSLSVRVAAVADPAGRPRHSSMVLEPPSKATRTPRISEKTSSAVPTAPMTMMRSGSASARRRYSWHTRSVKSMDSRCMRSRASVRRAGLRAGQKVKPWVAHALRAFRRHRGAGRALVGQRGRCSGPPARPLHARGRADDRGDVVGAVGRMRPLRAHPVLGAVLHEGRRMRSRRAARLAGDDDLGPGSQAVAHGLDLRGLSPSRRHPRRDEHSPRAAISCPSFVAAFLVASPPWSSSWRGGFLVVVFFAANGGLSSSRSCLRVRLRACPLARLSAGSS